MNHDRITLVIVLKCVISTGKVKKSVCYRNNSWIVSIKEGQAALNATQAACAEAHRSFIDSRKLMSF